MANDMVISSALLVWPTYEAYVQVEVFPCWNQVEDFVSRLLLHLDKVNGGHEEHLNGFRKSYTQHVTTTDAWPIPAHPSITFLFFFCKTMSSRVFSWSKEIGIQSSSQRGSQIYPSRWDWYHYGEKIWKSVDFAGDISNKQMWYVRTLVQHGANPGENFNWPYWSDSVSIFQDICDLLNKNGLCPHTPRHWYCYRLTIPCLQILLHRTLRIVTSMN